MNATCKRIRLVLFGLLTVTLLSGAHAETFTGLGFTGPESDGRPGEYYFYKGVEAVRKKDYNLAVDMYKVAASWAYKTAQYNLAVMYLHGEGVPVDRPRAMAWIALAAERGDQKYVDARERIYAELSAEEFAHANEIWRELKAEYADDAALHRAKTRWVQTRQATTGSHVGFVGDLAVGGDDPRGFPFPVPQIGHNSQPSGSEKMASPRIGAPADGFATAAFGLTGGNQVDGTIAYRQLQMSNNPYDPIFEHGTATVGPLQPVPASNDAAADQPAQDPAHPVQQNY